MLKKKKKSNCSSQTRMESDQLEKCLDGRHDLWHQGARLPTGPLRGLQGLCHHVTLGLQTVWGCSTLAPSCREPLRGKQGSGSPGAMRQGTGVKTNGRTEETHLMACSSSAKWHQGWMFICPFWFFFSHSLFLYRISQGQKYSKIWDFNTGIGILVK